jgi:hypothetical protein
MRTVRVTRRPGDDPLAFEVEVGDDAGRTRHEVTLAPTHLARLAPGVAPELCVEAAFRFLLDREPRETILGRFDLSVIARFFPEFERKFPGYLSATS